MRVSRTVVASIVAVAATVLALPAPASADRCASIGTARFTGMEYGRGIPYLFVAEEGTNENFTVRVDGDTCLGENGTVRWDTRPGTATEGTDYDDTTGQFGFDVRSRHEIFEQADTVPTNEDTNVEAAAETLDLYLTASGSPQPRVETPKVPMFIVDDDGATRARFAFSQMTWEEFAGTLRIPVLRAGSASSGTVNYSITPQTNDYSGGSTGQVSFNGRLGTINFTLVNDDVEEPEERFTVTLSGTTIDSPSTFTVIVPPSDAGQGDTTPPRAWFHHPKHRKQYRQGSFNADTIHLFADDNSGHQQVTSAQLALRKKMRNGNCKYWKRGAWRLGSCARPKWFPATTRYADLGRWLYIYTAYPSLRPSVGTRIANYTVYGRATDASGNRSRLIRGENRNTFEVTRR